MSGTCDRRSFVGGLFAAPFALPGAVPQEAPAPTSSTAPPPSASRDIDDATVVEAAKAIGLEFRDEERKRLAVGLLQQRASLEALRDAEIPNDLAPAVDFRVPRPPLRAPARSPGADARPEPPPGDPSADPWFRPIAWLSERLRRRELSAFELARRTLERLAEIDDELHLLVTLTEKLALDEALRADREIADGRWRGPLHGIPYGLKDLFAVRGHPTTWGAKPLREQVIDTDAAVYERLRAAGAVLVAKLSLGSLAMGDLWFGGRTRNPWNPEQGSSGSSAGSAAAVAAGALPFAIGTETLGSIVSPCTRCGVFGLRPTFGRVSRHGAMALSWSMDKVGPIARGVDDLALVFDAIRGPDPRDPSSVDAPFRFEPAADLKGRRIGFVPAHFEGERAAREAEVLPALRALGATLGEVDTRVPFRVEPLRLILDVEAAAAFEEFTRKRRVDELDGQGPNDWPDAFRLARFVPAVEFVQAQRLRTRLVAAWVELMSGLDALVTPSFRGGCLLPTNLTGHPACVVPIHLGPRGNTSITFVGQLFGEGTLLEVARAFEGSRPPLPRPDAR